MNYIEIRDFAMKIKDKLREQVNGYVKFEVYEEVGVLVFKVMLKEFEFKHAINVNDYDMTDGGAEHVTTVIYDHYKTYVNDTFFKTEQNTQKKTFLERRGFARV